MTRAARSIAIALVLALLASGPLAPLEAAQKTQPAASAEQTQDASSMPSSAMDQGQPQQAQDQQPPLPQAQEQQLQPQQAQEQPAQDQQTQDQPAIGQSQPQGQETMPGVITPPPARPTETATPPPPPPAQTPVQASQPDQFKEKVKTSRAPKRGSDGYDAGAVVVNIFRPPGKALLCGLGGVAGATLFLITFGSAYRGAAAAVAEGCGGKWFIGGEDLRPDSNRAGSFEWETHQFDWERK